MLAQQHPAKDTTEPHTENRLNNLTIHSTWDEILTQIVELENRIKEMEALPDGVPAENLDHS